MPGTRRAPLSQTGLLSEIVLDICANRFDVAAYEKRARSARRRSGQYLFSLAHRLDIRRLRTKIRLAKLAVAAAADNPVYASILAVTLSRADCWSEAEF